MLDQFGDRTKQLLLCWLFDLAVVVCSHGAVVGHEAARLRAVSPGGAQLLPQQRPAVPPARQLLGVLRRGCFYTQTGEGSDQ